MNKSLLAVPSEVGAPTAHLTLYSPYGVTIYYADGSTYEHAFDYMEDPFDEEIPIRRLRAGWFLTIDQLIGGQALEMENILRYTSPPNIIINNSSIKPRAPDPHESIYYGIKDVTKNARLHVITPYP